jgi:hypothetical protein
MELQDIKNVAGVTYVQTRLRQIGERRPAGNGFEKVTIDGMLGTNTTNALEAVTAIVFSTPPHEDWSCEFNYLLGMWNLQKWYKAFYHDQKSRKPTIFDTLRLPEPEEDGKWGKNTKACFDRFFELVGEHPCYSPRVQSIDLEDTDFHTVKFGDPKISGFHSFSIATENDKHWAAESEALLRSALAVAPDDQISVNVLAPYNVVIFARVLGRNNPEAVLVASKTVNTNSVSKLAQNTLQITGLHVDRNLSWEPVACGLISKLLEVAQYSDVEEIHHRQSFHRGTESRDVEELLISGFGFYKNETGRTMKRV